MRPAHGVGGGIICPTCSRPLDPAAADAEGMLTCECGHRCYAGYVAESAYLQRRQEWLQARIADQSPAPDPETMRAHGLWPAGQRPADQPRAGQQSTPRSAPVGAAVPTQIMLSGLGAGLLIIAAIVFVSVTWNQLGALAQILIMLAATATAIAAAVGLRHRLPRTAEAFAVVGFGMLIVDAAAAAEFGLVPTSWGQIDSGYTLLVALCLAVAGVLCGHAAGLRTWVWLGWACVLVAVVALTGVLVDLFDVEGQPATTAFALALVLVGFAMIFAGRLDRARADRVPLWGYGGTAVVIAGFVSMGLLDSQPPLGALLVLGVTVLLTWWLGRATGVAAWAWAATVGLGAELALLVQVYPGQGSVWIVPVVVATGAVVLFGFAGWQPYVALVAAAATWCVWLVLRLIHTVDDPLSDQVGVWLLLVGAVLWVAAYVHRDLAAVGWLAAVLWVSSALVLQPDIDWDVPEAYTLALAALLAVAGWLQYRAGVRHSILIAGPAASMALIPSAVLVWVDPWHSESLLRFLVVMVAGVVVLWIGVRTSRLGLVLPAAVAVAIAAMAQIWQTLDLFPRWVALSIAGALLLLVGARIEAVKRRGEQAEDWLQTLR